jgi:predicted metal-binding membrane protein
MNTPTDMSVVSFAGGWVVMTAAMMLPSAIPFVVSFSRSFSWDRLWPLAAGLLVLVYMGVWLAVGLGLFAVSTVVPMPMPSVVVTALAVAFAGAYAFSPLRGFGASRCAELCRRFEGTPGGAFRAALSRGGRYGLACVLCTAGVMVAVFVVGMSDLRLMALGAAAVLLVKARSWRVALG